jgi:hypothetical protein
MKNKWVLMLGVLLVCGLVFIGCDNGTTPEENTDPKSLTITDIPTSLDGIVVGVKPTSKNENDALVYGYGTDLSSGTVTIQLKNKSASNGYDEEEDDWTGVGGYYLFAWESSDGTFSGDPDWYIEQKVNFQTAETSIPWASVLTYTEPKSLTITGISSSDLGGTNGAWIGLFEEIPQDSFPQFTAIGYGEISGSSVSVGLTVPNDNTFVNSDNPWRGAGDYYVMIVPISGGEMQDGTLVFTNAGNSPVKKTFSTTPTSFAIGEFKPISELSLQ